MKNGQERKRTKGQSDCRPELHEFSEPRNTSAVPFHNTPITSGLRKELWEASGMKSTQKVNYFGVGLIL